MVVVVEIVIDKEIGVSPFIALEHLQSEGCKLPVTAKVVEELRIHLCVQVAIPCPKER